MGCLTLEAERKDALSIDCSLICLVDRGNYLYVKPRRERWLMKDCEIIYKVRSNTDWKVE